MTGLLKNITVYVDFTRNGTVIYSGITFALYNGVLTGQRPGAYSVSLNARCEFLKEFVTLPTDLT